MVVSILYLLASAQRSCARVAVVVIDCGGLLRKKVDWTERSGVFCFSFMSPG